MNTVTIELEKYEALKQRIVDLEKQVQAKTIIKEVHPEWWRIVVLGVILVPLLLVLFNHRPF